MSYKEWNDLYGSRMVTEEYEAFKLDNRHLAHKIKFMGNITAAIKARCGADYTSIICCPLGQVHKSAVESIPQFAVETGIGYQYPWSKYRVYESYAWYHYTMGVEKQMGDTWYHTVIPCAFDPTAYGPVVPTEKKQNYFVMACRLHDDKGVNIGVSVARALGIPIKLIGQGDASPYLGPGVEYRKPMSGPELRELLRYAKGLFQPTRYVEPFGKVTIDAGLCFPANVPVRAEHVERLYSRIYSGILIQLTTDDNSSIECTPEHPFLTQRGWVAASDLTSSDYLIRRCDESAMDTERIGHLVERLSCTGTSQNSSEAVSNRGGCVHEGEETENTEDCGKNVSSFYSEGIGSSSKTLHQTRRGQNRSTAEEVVEVCLPCSKGPGFEEGQELGAVHGGRDKTSAEQLRAARGRAVGDTYGAQLQSCEDESIKTRPSQDITSLCKVPPSNNAPDRVGLSCGSDRWGGYSDLQSKIQKAEPNSAVCNNKYVVGDDRMDSRKDSDPQYACDRKTGFRQGILERLPAGSLDHSGARHELSTSVQSVTPISYCETATDGNVGRVGDSSARTVERIVRDNGAWPTITAHDPIYEFARIRNISRREVKDVPVFNVGTRSGTYEAAGYVVHNCGCPCIVTDFGVFTETILHGMTGYRCRTWDQFMWAAKNVDKINPYTCHDWCAANYSLDRVGKMYKEYFDSIMDLNGKAGWHTEHPERTQLDWLKMDHSMLGEHK